MPDTVRDALPECRTANGLILLTTAGCPVIDMPATGGWLVGSLFDREGRQPCAGLASSEQLAIMSSKGRWLIEQASGSYVGFWRDSGAGPLMALRDPAACLPAFASIDGAIAVSSDIRCLHLAGRLSLHLDIEGIARHLRFPLIPSESHLSCRRPRADTRCCHEPVGRTSTNLLWRPVDFARRARTDIERIAGAVDAVVAGLSNPLTRQGIELSGGLDSSIVAAALPHPRDVHALHLVPAAQDGDERRYAGEVCQQFDMDMTDIPIGYEDVDLLEPPTRPDGAANRRRAFRCLDRKLLAAQTAAKLTAVFSGGGGDSVFCALQSTGPVIDAWHDGGVRLAWETLGNVAAVSGVTIWDAAAILSPACCGPRWPANPGFPMTACSGLSGKRPALQTSIGSPV